MSYKADDRNDSSRGMDQATGRSPFPLWMISLAEGSEFGKAQDAGISYLLDLDCDRLLQPFRRECGLAPDGLICQPYPNWESMGMSGHICGHYLSALAGYWESTRDEVFLERATYMVDTIRDCQDHLGTGYVGGVPDGVKVFGSLLQGIHAQSFELNGSWVPLYNLHKLFSGLIDIWISFRQDDGLPDGALPACSHLVSQSRQTVIELADWWCRLSDKLTDDQFESMLACEFGGMNEAYARLYELTGELRYLKEAERFCDKSLLEPLGQGKDVLTGLHANTQIPKVLGYEYLSELTHRDVYGRAVETFWNSVVHRRSISIGAHSVAEHFHDPEDFESLIRSRQGVETCNSCNMAKLAERMYRYTGDADYLDFYERVTQNHIVSTVARDGIEGMVYFTPARPRHYRVYSSPQKCFWCCVGSGLEFHARYKRLIYSYQSTPDLDRVFVDLFVPSTLDWSERQLTIRQTIAKGPGLKDKAIFELKSDTAEPRSLELCIRRPWWSEKTEYRFEGGDGSVVCRHEGTGVDYDVIDLTWSGRLSISMTRGVKLSVEQLPDESSWASVLRGPKVMAADEGSDDMDGFIADESRTAHIPSGPIRSFSDLPVLVGAAADLPVRNQPQDDGLTVRVHYGKAGQGDHTGERTLRPFSALGCERYSIYFPWVSSSDQIEAVRNHLSQLDASEAGLEARICDLVSCGEQQSEIDHGYEGMKDEQMYVDGHHCRRAGKEGHFSYVLKDWERTGEFIEVSWLPLGSGDETDPYMLQRDGTPLEFEAMQRRSEASGLMVDSYRIAKGALGVGEDMSSRIRIQSNAESDGPAVVSVALLK